MWYRQCSGADHDLSKLMLGIVCSPILDDGSNINQIFTLNWHSLSYLNLVFRHRWCAKCGDCTHGADQEFSKLILGIFCGSGLDNNIRIPLVRFSQAYLNLVFHHSWRGIETCTAPDVKLTTLGTLICIAFKYSSTWVAPYYSHKLLKDLSLIPTCLITFCIWLPLAYVISAMLCCGSWLV